jgi:hypothetical protein
MCFYLDEACTNLYHCVSGPEVVAYRPFCVPGSSVWIKFTTKETGMLTLTLAGIQHFREILFLLFYFCIVIGFATDLAASVPEPVGVADPDRACILGPEPRPLPRRRPPAGERARNRYSIVCKYVDFGRYYR